VIRCFGISDIGCARSSNEDAYIAEPDLGLFVVADGMGGAQAGEQASAIATRTIARYVRRAAPRRSPESLLEAIQTANREILRQASENPRFHGMGTTVVALLVSPPAAYIASVGDSRAYLFRGGELHRLTSDQTWVNEVGRSLGLTEEQIHSHPFRNVLTMAVGARERLEIHSHELRLEPGDILLLSSDGLHGVVPEVEIAATLAAADALEEKAASLIRVARAYGGPDNITALLVENARS
jgi:serine/threonine protein phosphatase PrpC